MKLLLGFLIIIIISIILSIFTVKLIRKNLEGQFIYKNDHVICYKDIYVFWNNIFC